jgi:hypothetical protein
MEIATLIIEIFILVILVAYHLWLSPKLRDVEKIINIYKGMGNDYAQWHQQHKTELDEQKNQHIELKKAYKELTGAINRGKTEIVSDGLEYSVRLLEAFLHHISIIKSTLTDVEEGRYSWLQRALQTGMVLKHVSIIEVEYTEILRESQEFLKTLGKDPKRPKQNSQ